MNDYNGQDSTVETTSPVKAPRRLRRHAARRAALAASALAIGGAGFGIGQAFSAGAPAVSVTSVTPKVTPNASASSPSISTGATSAARIARSVDKGLVDINTNLSYENAQAAGTGMVLTSNGEVLTNNHVIEGATAISVTDIGNGKTYTATVVGYDRTHDLAVLQLSGASGLKTVRIGDSAKVRKGDTVIGIGNAGGVGGTPSFAAGTVTARNQSIVASDAGAGNSETLYHLLQTNANIQPGDSGGPLVNTSGQVIAIDTAGSSGGFSETVPGTTTAAQGFAIPINEATTIAKQIVAGRVSTTVHLGSTAFLGVQVESVTAGSPTGGFGIGFGGGFSTASATGAEVVGLVQGAPASSAGLVDGDIITSVNNQSVTDASSLTTVMLGATTGTSVPVVFVDSSGQQHTTSVILGSGPPL